MCAVVVFLRFLLLLLLRCSFFMPFSLAWFGPYKLHARIHTHTHECRFRYWFQWCCSGGERLSLWSSKVINTAEAIVHTRCEYFVYSPWALMHQPFRISQKISKKNTHECGRLIYSADFDVNATQTNETKLCSGTIGEHCFMFIQLKQIKYISFDMFFFSSCVHSPFSLCIHYAFTDVIYISRWHVYFSSFFATHLLAFIGPPFCSTIYL